jgi:large subunit ribosomal protein L6
MEKLYKNVKINLIKNYLVEVGGALGMIKKIFTGKDIHIFGNRVFLKSKSSFVTFSSILNKMFIGVQHGYYVNLTFFGIGYRFIHLTKKVLIKIGYTHYLYLGYRNDIYLLGHKRKLLIYGIDYETVNRIGATVRQFRKPDIYKGKGIRYKDEKIVLKVGKQR